MHRVRDLLRRCCGSPLGMALALALESVALPAITAPTFTKITSGPIVDVQCTAFAWADYNHDGWIDLFGTPGNGGAAFLYRNNGHGTFERILTGSIVAGGGNSFGCVWADFDNDGHMDLFRGVYNFGPNNGQLYRNNGDETFTQIVSGAVANSGIGANNCVWGDYDRDGLIDLFLACAFIAPNNLLFHNEGGGVFRKLTNDVIVSQTSLGASWADYDNDGYLDLFACRPGNAVLYRNNHSGGFAVVTNSGLTFPSGGMAAPSWGDYDNDGYLDLFVGTSAANTPNSLFRNNRDGTFSRVTNGPLATDLASPGGGAWADYDNDGWLDLFFPNSNGTQGFLYHNEGDGNFVRVLEESPVTDAGNGQGAAWADYDNNGFPDLIVPNRSGYNNFLYRNNGNSNNWLTIQCEGRRSNRAAIGTKVRVQALLGGRWLWQMREISGGGSLGSQNDLRQGFGLAEATNAALVRVEWPSGLVQQLTNVAARQFLTIIEPDAFITPAAQEIQPGQRVTLTVNTTLDPPVELQWKLNGLVLLGETNTTLNIAAAQAQHGGTYSAIVSQLATGLSFETRPALLTGPTVITLPPASVNVRPGSNVLLRVSATGISPLTYQWRFNGATLLEATNATLLLTNAQLSQAGIYDVIVANVFGPVLSAPATLGILINPVFVQQPLSQSVVVGGSLTLSATASGSPGPFTFEWRRGTLGLWTNFTSQPLSFLALTNVATNQAGNYRVVVKNPANFTPGIISSNAVVTVLADTDGDGLPDDWELANGLTQTNAADADWDSDGDGASNRSEYTAGTNPRDAQSFLKVDHLAFLGTNAWLIQFWAMSNRTYSLQARDSFGDANWVSAAEVPATATNRLLEITLPAHHSPRFFRLVTPRTL